MVEAVLEGRKTQTRRVNNRWEDVVKGDILYVRETFAQKCNSDSIVFRADYVSRDFIVDAKWKPSIFLRKEHARIWLEVENVDKERLHDISGADAVAEGASLLPDNGIAYSRFQELWCAINGRESWDANPWVWVIKYKVLSTTGRPSHL